MLDRLLDESGDPSAEAFSKMLTVIDNYIPVQTAVRGAAFVLGFEACRQLLLGELNLKPLKGGAE